MIRKWQGAQSLYCMQSHILTLSWLQEFHPYVFQIFSQLIELRQPPLPSTYMDLLRPLLTPTLWERPGNVPALVRLTTAYLSKAGVQIMQMNLQLVSS